MDLLLFIEEMKHLVTYTQLVEMILEDSRFASYGYEQIISAIDRSYERNKL